MKQVYLIDDKTQISLGRLLFAVNTLLNRSVNLLNKVIITVAYHSEMLTGCNQSTRRKILRNGCKEIFVRQLLICLCLLVTRVTKWTTS